MGFDIDALRRAVERHGRVARVVITDVRGSSPREPGAAMLVWPDGQSGTIGGGALEYQAAHSARRALIEGTDSHTRHALGPDLGQCCGGSVQLLCEIYDTNRLVKMGTPPIIARALKLHAPKTLAITRLLTDARKQGTIPGAALIDSWFVEPLHRAVIPVWIWGAGHVGRAIVDTLYPLPDFDITWIDRTQNRFPPDIPKCVNVLTAEQPTRLMPHAPQNARHLILTYSHELDFALCHAALTRGFASAGVIGSKTKWVRFHKRLAALGHTTNTINNIQSPIGDPNLGKHPQAIAVGVVSDLIRNAAQQDANQGDNHFDRYSAVD